MKWFLFRLELLIQLFVSVKITLGICFMLKTGTQAAPSLVYFLMSLKKGKIIPQMFPLTCQCLISLALVSGKYSHHQHWKTCQSPYSWAFVMNETGKNNREQKWKVNQFMFLNFWKIPPELIGFSDRWGNKCQSQVLKSWGLNSLWRQEANVCFMLC